jgi:hypothetical protein
MTTESPPARRGPAPSREPAPSVEVTTTDSGSVARQLRRRRAAARRMAGGDPWTADHRDWQDSWDVEMARCGWAPRWQQERARQLAGVR